jgi:hypothetical protein
MPEDDDWIFELNGGSGSAGGDSSGDSGDIIFDDSEVEVFEETEIVFDDDTEVEVFESQEAVDVNLAAKASCRASAAEANGASIALAAVTATLSFGGLKFPAYVTALEGAAFRYMGTIAQACANDPPRTDTGVVAKYRRLPIRRPRQASGEQAAAYAVAAAALQVADALARFTTSLERFDGAREALKAGDEEARRHVFLQAAAITHNARLAGLQIAWLNTAVTNHMSRLGSLSNMAETIRERTVTEVVELVEAAWKGARGAFDVDRTPQTFNDIEAQQQGFVAAIRDGSITPMSMAAAVENGIAATAIVKTGQSLQLLANTFNQAGRVERPQ